MTGRCTRKWRIALGAALGAVLVLGAGASRGDRVEISAPFSSASAAEGWARLNVWSNQAYLHLGLERLQPRTSYELQANGVRHASLTTDDAGRFEGFFYLFPEDGREPALYLDPRGQLLSIVDRQGKHVLAMVFSGPLEPPETRVEERVDLEPSSLAPASGWGRAEFHRESDGSSWLEITAVGLDLGEEHAVRVDERKRAEVLPGGAGWIQVRLDDIPDPRGKAIQIIDSQGRAIYAGELFTAIPGADAATVPTPVQFTVRLPGFVDNPAVAVRLWRREPGQSSWELATTIFLWPAEPGSGTVRYSYIDPATGGVDASSDVVVAAQWGSDGSLTFPLHYVRLGPEALFKASALNQIGESPRSRDAVLR